MPSPVQTWHAPHGLQPYRRGAVRLRSELLDIEWMLDEPFYQLMRQQLLVWRLERDGRKTPT